MKSLIISTYFYGGSILLCPMNMTPVLPFDPAPDTIETLAEINGCRKKIPAGKSFYLAPVFIGMVRNHVIIRYNCRSRFPGKIHIHKFKKSKSPLGDEHIAEPFPLLFFEKIAVLSILGRYFYKKIPYFDPGTILRIRHI
jgi:hypothetical protein